MSRQNSGRPSADTLGGRRPTDASGFHVQHTPRSSQKQAPPGRIPATFGPGGLICIAGRHVCSVRGADLRRTFDPTRELYQGGLAFRADVLRLAVTAGAHRIVATDRTSKSDWVISLADFRAHGWRFENERYGAQWCCALEHWTPPAVDTGAPQQAMLFDLGGAL